MTGAELSNLQELTAQRRWRDVSRLIEALARRKLDAPVLPVVRPLLTVKDYVIYKYAITLVGKLRNPPPEAFEAVLDAWQATWLNGCPQCTDEALGALLALDRTDPRLITEIERCLAVDNYQVHKACATALMAINSPEARRVLEEFPMRLPRPYTEKLMVDLLGKIRTFLAT